MESSTWPQGAAKGHRPADLCLPSARGDEARRHPEAATPMQRLPQTERYMSTDAKKDTLTVVVGGSPVELHANENQELSVIIKQALREANQTGRPDGDWELRAGADANATLLDPSKK